MIATIKTNSVNGKTNKATTGHAAALRELGYTVVEKTDHIEIETSGAYEGKLNLAEPNAQEVLASIIKDRKILTYTTKIGVTLADGTKADRTAHFACPFLKAFGIANVGVDLSCLMANLPKVEVPKPVVDPAKKAAFLAQCK